MTGIATRYACAVHSCNLTSDPDTTRSDSDVLGAMGIAGKPWISDGPEKRRGSPLGAALMRLYSGDNHASGQIVGILADKAVGKAYRDYEEIPRVSAVDMARKLLAWHRDGRCTKCGGHGVLVIPGTLTLGNERCQVCSGTGCILLERHFSMDRLPLALWLLGEMEREMGVAAPLAMRALSPREEA